MQIFDCGTTHAAFDEAGQATAPDRTTRNHRILRASPEASIVGQSASSGHGQPAPLAPRRYRTARQADGVNSERAGFADDLPHNIEAGDGFSRMFRENVDAHIERNGIGAPPPTAGGLDGEPRLSDPPLSRLPSIDLAAENVTIIVWATGFRVDLSRIDVPVCNDMGCPVTDCGATSVPGLNWMVTRTSGLLHGVGNDAGRVASHMAGYLAS